jgi:hypothetical protein
LDLKKTLNLSRSRVNYRALIIKNQISMKIFKRKIILQKIKKINWEILQVTENQVQIIKMKIHLSLFHKKTLNRILETQN